MTIHRVSAILAALAAGMLGMRLCGVHTADGRASEETAVSLPITPESRRLSLEETFDARPKLNSVVRTAVANADNEILSMVVNSWTGDCPAPVPILDAWIAGTGAEETLIIGVGIPNAPLPDGFSWECFTFDRNGTYRDYLDLHSPTQPTVLFDQEGNARFVAFDKLVSSESRKLTWWTLTPIEWQGQPFADRLPFYIGPRTGTISVKAVPDWFQGLFPEMSDDSVESADIRFDLEYDLSAIGDRWLLRRWGSVTLLSDEVNSRTGEAPRLTQQAIHEIADHLWLDVDSGQPTPIF